MKKLYSSNLFDIFYKLVILLIIAKAISLVILWYLPSDGIDFSIEKNYKPKYQRVSFKNMLNAKEIHKIENKHISKISSSIENMVLKGLYGTKSKAFVIIALKKSADKTSIIGIGETYAGYTLKSVTISGAIFKKNSKDYVLNLKKLSPVLKSKDNIFEKPIKIQRKEINKYISNPKEIFKNISIIEIKNANETKGFKITRIKHNSIFVSFGLKVGDLMVKVNNIELKSYKNALDIYKKINKIDELEIVIIRNNQEMELRYEIN